MTQQAWKVYKLPNQWQLLVRAARPRWRQEEVDFSLLGFELPSRPHEVDSRDGDMEIGGSMIAKAVKS